MINSKTYETLSSMLTPGTLLPMDTTAQVETLSTMLAMAPPWSAPTPFNSSVETGISHVMWPSDPSTILTFSTQDKKLVYIYIYSFCFPLISFLQIFSIYTSTTQTSMLCVCTWIIVTESSNCWRRSLTLITTTGGRKKKTQTMCCDGMMFSVTSFTLQIKL